MADNTVRRYGDTGAKEQPESGEKNNIVRGVETTRVWRGTVTELQAIMPLIGDSSADGDVVSSTLSPEEGDCCKLTVKYIEQAEDTGFVKLPFQQNPRIEITFNQIEKSIESHPTKGLMSSDGITPNYEKLGQLEAWRQAPPSRKQQFQIPKTGTSDPKLDNDADWESLADDVKKIAAKNLAGMENYILFVPLVRRIGVSLNKPTLSTGAVIETPPESAPGSFQYLRLGDSTTQREDGSWELVEVWQGCDKIDTDYYS